ncbi:GTP 3',8-cyclase, mitochondrial [Porphyridium purpureum]|uniref:GTP 3',8-cyclase n=1 Tax=Porphyridium purpureum TaxID=35688 RepID=A0A5J4YVT7_PORPP|nr:GTP 3',8-cyclase, mitochondrial [Porphyridium purpureum]|eukprot:POR4016..scf227_4
MLWRACRAGAVARRAAVPAWTRACVSQAQSDTELVTQAATSAFGGTSMLQSASAHRERGGAGVEDAVPALERARKRETSRKEPAVHDALVDGFGRTHTYLRISLTERCNLRCLYCMPEEGVPLTPSEKLLTASEIDRLVDLFVSLGVHKVRLTGGEPTVRKDFDDIARRIGKRPQIRSFGITTNGIALRRRLPELAASGVNKLNISLDTLIPERFERITRRPGLHKVLESIHAALSMPEFSPVKVNAVVMRGTNEDEICSFVRLLEKQPRLEIRFIEYMPFDGNKWNEPKFFPYEEMKALIEREFGLPLRRAFTPDPAKPGALWEHQTAKTYTLDGFSGRMGFISSMSENFCGGCTRLRLTADGNLKVCLFGKAEVSLRDAMRGGASDDDLVSLISASVKRKHFALGGSKDRHELALQPNRPMISIGG